MMTTRKETVMITTTLLTTTSEDGLKEDLIVPTLTSRTVGGMATNRQLKVGAITDGEIGIIVGVTEMEFGSFA